MLEVVFSDSAKGSMKMAKNYKKESTIGGAISYIGFSLDVGDISGEIDGIERQEVFHNLWSHVDFDEKEIERFFHMQHEDLEKLLSAAKEGIPIRIWKSNAPFSACGFAFICHVLRNIDCKVSVVSLPGYLETFNNTVVSYSNWGEISSEEFYNFLSYKRELSNIEKRIQVNLWEDLKVENTPLRAIVNSKLISVPEDFYDHLIIKNIPDEEFIMSQLIGNILGKYQLGVGDSWYALRIKKMIEENKLKVVADKNPSHPYGKILKRTTI